jgi:hypothetical protein
MTDMTDGPGLPAQLAATREGWHRIAEHILAAALHAESGKIALSVSPGGFRTPPFGADGRFLAVDGTELVVSGRNGRRRVVLTTLRAAAEFTGITPGAPAQVYPAATPLDLDEPLMIDPDAARVLADWYALGTEALSRFVAEVPEDDPSPAVLWPEHFDVGVTAGAVNYGASPGDGHVPDPYVYVGPQGGPPPGNPEFWNAPFGAARTIHQIGTVPDAVAFFREGRARLLARAAASPEGPGHPLSAAANP